jgi:hypothetical protein
MFKVLLYLAAAVFYFTLTYYLEYGNLKTALHDSTFEVNVSGLRRTYVRMLSFGLSQFLTQQYVWNASALSAFAPSYAPPRSPYSPLTSAAFVLPNISSSQISNKLDSFAFFQNALVYGSTYLHVDPPSQCPGQSPLLFTSACVGSSPADCSTVQNGVMQRGLATALTNYMTTARALLDSVAFTQSTSPSLLMTWATLNATLNSPDMMGLRAMERAYLYPPLLQSSKLYSIKATDQLAAVEPVRVTLLCAFIAYADINDARIIQFMFGFSMRGF